MSLEPRPEAAPVMGKYSFEGLGQFIDYCRVEFQRHDAEEIASLTIEGGDTEEFHTRDEKHSNSIEYLNAGKAAISKDILQLRRYSCDFEHEEQICQVKGWRGLDHLRSLRHFSIIWNIIGLDAMTPFVHGHSTLSSLSLVNNGIIPNSPLIMRYFAQGLSMSNLRMLDLNNNAIGTRSIVEFIDNLIVPALTHLSLSMTMQKKHLKEDQRTNPLWTSDSIEQKEQWQNESSKDTWRRELIRVGDSLANLVSGNKKVGYAPRLEKLSLNANDFDWRTIKKMVTSILDGNRSLIEVELFATMNPGDSDDEDSNEPSNVSIAPTRSNSIGSMYYRNRQASKVNHGQGNATPPRKNSSASAIRPRVILSKQNWRGELGRHLWENRLARKNAKDASRHILPVMRTLTCKCREDSKDNTSKPFFPFTRLPPEIRAKVITSLNDETILSSHQLQRILSFASNPATLGYGTRSTNLGLSDMALQQIRQEALGSGEEEEEEDCNDYGLIPHHRWTWKEMMRDFPMPRDWPATILDENQRRAKAGEGEDDHSETEGLGGGGPDGLGGVTYERAGPDASRRRWLEEQSGLHAFWETTGTYREE